MRYADSIFVREQDAQGRWGSFALSELPVKTALKHACRFMAEGSVPVRLLSEEEVKANAARNESER